MGRQFTEAPDITARICGICPVAYQMSACAAMEDACGVEVTAGGGDLAACSTAGSGYRAMPCTSTSSTLPTSSAVPMQSSWPSATAPRSNAASPSRGPATCSCRPWAAGPSTPSTSGSAASTRAPDPRRVAALVEPLRRARRPGPGHGRWVAGFDFPDVEGDYRFVALAHGGPLRHRVGPAGVLEEGLDVSRVGLRPAGGRGARGTLHRAARPRSGGDRLPDRPVGPLRAELPRPPRGGMLRRPPAAGLGPMSPTRSGASSCGPSSLVFACDEALRLVESYEPPSPPAVGIPIRGGRGCRGDRGAAGPASAHAMHSMPTATSSPLASCHRPRRTRSALRPTSDASCKAHWTFRTPIFRGAASRRCATMTRASRALPTSSTSRWSGSERDREHRGDGPPGRRCPQGSGGRPGQRVPPRRRRRSCRCLHGAAAMPRSDSGRAAR